MSWGKRKPKVEPLVDLDARTVAALKDRGEEEAVVVVPLDAREVASRRRELFRVLRRRVRQAEWSGEGFAMDFDGLPWVSDLGR